MDWLAESYAKLTVSDYESVSASDSPGRFASISRAERTRISDTVKKIRKALTATDLAPGLVYVAKQAGTSFSKVGFTARDDASRIGEIVEQCKVDFDLTHYTPLFDCAYRAEQIIHSLLHDSAHDRLDCKCGKKNREWYKKDYDLIIKKVYLVYDWLAQKPYDMDSGGLKPEWHQALVIWNKSQEDEKPPTWTDFFRRGLSLPSVLERKRKISSSSKKVIATSTANGIYNPSSSGEVRPEPRRARFRVRPRILFQVHSSPARLPSCKLVDGSPLESASPTSRPSSLVRVQTTPSKIPKTIEADESPLTTPGKPIFGLESSCPQTKSTTEVLGVEDRGNNPGSINKRHFRWNNNIQTSVRKSVTRDCSTTDEDSNAESDCGQQLLDDGDSEDAEDSDYEPSTSESAESSAEEELTDEEMARDQAEVAGEVKGLISAQHAYLNDEVELTSSIESLEVGQGCSADQKELSRNEGDSSEDDPAGIESAEDDLADAVSGEREELKGRGAKKPIIKIGCTAQARLRDRKERSAVKRPSTPLSGHTIHETSTAESTSSYWGTSSKSICFGMAAQKASQDHPKVSFRGLDLTAVKSTASSKRTKSGGRNHI